MADIPRKNGTRALLFTLLGEFVLPCGGSAWTSAFLDVFARLGVEEKAARQALARTAADGWIAPARHGRRTRWLLTDAGRRLLTEGTERIYAFAGAQRDWDGTWLLVLARVPEALHPGGGPAAGRAVRHLLRTRLSWAGLGTPAPGIFITTYPERHDEVARVLRQAGIADAQIFRATQQGGGSLETLIAQAWDLPAIEKRYEEFIAEFGPSASSADPLTGVAGLVHAWRQFPSIDPGLPIELLPRPWRGERAATLFAARHASWAPRAQSLWHTLNA